MRVGGPTTVTSTTISPITSAGDAAARLLGTSPSVSGASDALANQRRAAFLAALNATTNTSSGTYTPTLAAGTSVAAQNTPAEKFPSAYDLELDGADTADMYRAAMSATGTSETEAEPVFETPTSPQAQKFQSATRQYAQAYFAGNSTFAARGESLEVRA
jgi:hypothetical protein